MLCLSGRGDKDLAEVTCEAMARGCDSTRPSQRRDSRPPSARPGEGRAALMPYMMAGFPDQESSLAVAAAYADAGADLIELGVPFSDPLADGPDDPRRRHRGAGAGATLARRSEVCESVPSGCRSC